MKQVGVQLARGTAECVKRFLRVAVAAFEHLLQCVHYDCSKARSTSLLDSEARRSVLCVEAQ